MVSSADEVFALDSNIVFHVFTDQTDFCLRKLSEFKNVKVQVHEIDNLIWPAATIDRYKIFFEAKDFLAQDFLVHMDADMIIHKNFIEALEIFPLKKGITCVAHPGYWRKPSVSKGVHAPSQRIKDLLLKIRLGALGAWETNPESSAFVPRSLRQNYVCGGVWMGDRLAFIDLCETLNQNVKSDELRKVIAKWHDESHLNKWVSTHDFNLLPPSFCYSADYTHLSGLENIIEAVTKDKKFSEQKRPT
jgi:hypothetical protein